jgi:hypothetical protein
VADAKITDLTALTGASVATGDLLPIVDVSDTTMAASGTDKKITIAELLIGLAALPLAGGTISGALDVNGYLTVASSTGVVDSNSSHLWAVWNGSNGAVISMANSERIGWSGNANAIQTVFTAIGRNADGVVEINNGTPGTFRDLKLRDLVATGKVTIGGTSASASAGEVSIGGVTRTTIGANGAASALTALPLGYIDAYVGSTPVSIPYYNRGA